MQANAIQEGESKPESRPEPKPKPLLTRKQETGLAALISQPTMKEAATLAGVNEATLWRWLQLPDFEKAYRQARRETVKHAIVKLQAASSQAVDVLIEVMTDETAPEFARLAAAKAVLEFSMKAVEVDDLAVRVAELERLLEPPKKGVR